MLWWLLILPSLLSTSHNIININLLTLTSLFKKQAIVLCASILLFFIIYPEVCFAPYLPLTHIQYISLFTHVTLSRYTISHLVNICLITIKHSRINLFFRMQLSAFQIFMVWKSIKYTINIKMYHTSQLHWTVRLLFQAFREERRKVRIKSKDHGCLPLTFSKVWKKI